MQYDFPQIVFRVRTIDDVQLVGQSFPSSKENILKNLEDRTVWVDYVPYALKHGDSFVLFGQQALDVYNQYFGKDRKVNKINNYGWTLDVVYYGPYVPATAEPTSGPTPTPPPPTPTPSPTPLPFCLIDNNTVTIQDLSGFKYVFNGSYQTYGFGLGSYLFANIPASHPIAFLNKGKESLVSYSGQFSQTPAKIAPDGNVYTYVYGDVILNVYGDFGTLSYADFYFGYFGGENNFVYYSPCTTIKPNACILILSNNDSVGIYNKNCLPPLPTPNACIVILSNNSIAGIYNEECLSPVPTLTPEPTISPTPTATPTPTPFNQGRLWLWGHNKFGQIGNNNEISQSFATQTTYSTTDWFKISSGFGHNLMLKSNGSIWGWGLNLHGELGTGNNLSTSSPVQIGSANTWIQASAGIFNSAGIKSDNTLWAWGSNAYGQAGNSSTANVSSPIQIAGNNWKFVTANGNSCFALKTDNTAWVWGKNNDGQLGLNNKIGISSPVQLGTTSDWKFITSGAWHKAGIKTDGTLWLWGGNFGAQIGDGTTTNRSSPVQVISGGNDWAYVSCGFNHTAAIKNDGSMWLWGNNSIGQLGINNLVNYRNPVREITYSTNWVKVECGYYFNVALNTNNNIYVWGINDKGQLGLDDKVNRSSPIIYPFGIGQWKDIAAGVDYISALSDIYLTPRPTPSPTPTPTPTIPPNACVLILSNNNNIGIYKNTCPTIIPTGTPVLTLTPTPTPSFSPSPTPSPTPSPSPTPNACIVVLSNNNIYGIYNQNCPIIIPTGTPIETESPTTTPSPTPTPTPSPTPNACVVVISNNSSTGMYNKNCPNQVPFGTPEPT